MDDRDSARDALAAAAAQLRALAAADAQRARLTGDASARDGRVRVSVDADGRVSETTLTADARDLSLSDLAKAITAAAAAAFADVERKRTELFAPLLPQRGTLPTPLIPFDDLPDIGSILSSVPVPRPAEPAPADHRDRGDSLVASDDHAVAAMEFTDVEAPREPLRRSVRDDSR